MTYNVVLVAAAQRDFRLIFEFLAESYINFGEGTEEAEIKAKRRVQSIRETITRLGRLPHRGTTHDHMLPGLRHVTFGQAIVWFQVDDDAQTVRVLAVFFGGQDHTRKMLTRLLGG